MKKIIVLFTLILACNLIAFALPKRIVLSGGTSRPGRDGNSLYPDMPAAYYEYSSKGQRIIIDGGGAVSYFDVEISSATTGVVEMTTTVSGTYDTFNITSLSAGTHVITIDSPSGNTFEGTF